MGFVSNRVSRGPVGVTWKASVAALVADVRAIIARGAPGPVLVDEAGPEDLLVIGAARRGGWSRLVSGRVARYCLRHAGCPVLAVPPAALGSTGLRGWAFRHRELTLDRAMREWGKAAA